MINTTVDASKLCLTAAFCAVLFLGSQKCNAQSFHKAVAESPRPGTMFIYPERIALKGGGWVTADRGLLFAPLVRSKEGSDVIAIEFYRFRRAETADPATPPVFMLRGGPGFPGLEASLKERGFYEQNIEQGTKRSDIVVVGQRGIGSSKPDTVIEQSVPAQPVDQPYDAEKAESDFQKVLSRERQYWIDEGVDLTGFNVLEAADDIRDIAKGLGYEKISIIGGSFGSHWGMTLIRKYPDLVARAVLHGMEGPDHTWDHPGWLWNVYKRVAKDAESSDRLKEHIPEGGLVAAAEALAAKVREEPLTIVINEGRSSEKKVVIDSHSMGRFIRGMGRLERWPAEIIQMHHGQFDQKAQQMMMMAMASGRQQLSTASFWMLDSGSGITAKRRAEFEADPAMDIIGSTFWYYSAGSPVWKTDLGDDFRSNFETEVPTLIVHGTWDTSTPYENAVELAPYFKNSKFVTVNRGSHGAYGEALRESGEFRSALDEFLKTGNLSNFPSEIDLPAPKWTTPKIDSKE